MFNFIFIPFFVFGCCFASDHAGKRNGPNKRSKRRKEKKNLGWTSEWWIFRRFCLGWDVFHVILGLVAVAVLFVPVSLG
jgi:hypothetical protein